MDIKQTIQRLMAVGFGVTEALDMVKAEAGTEIISQLRDDNGENIPAVHRGRRTMTVPASVARAISKGPRMAYQLSKRARSMRNLTVSTGNNTAVLNVMLKAKRPLTVADLAKLSGVKPHSVESVLYQFGPNQLNIIDKIDLASQR
jgi:hypothetical protein